MKRHVLEQVYQAYYSEVYLYAFSLCRNPAEAEELTSETFFRALLSLDETAPSVKYWLLRVCKNCFLDECRRRRRFVPWAPDELPVFDGVLERLIAQEETRALYRCLLRLPPTDRELVYLYYFAGNDVAGVAALTGRKSGAVKTALCRARQKLKRMMEEDGA